MHVNGILSSLGTVDFDDASLIGTAYPHAVLRNDDVQGEDPSSRKGLKPAGAETMKGGSIHESPAPGS